MLMQRETLGNNIGTDRSTAREKIVHTSPHEMHCYYGRVASNIDLGGQTFVGGISSSSPIHMRRTSCGIRVQECSLMSRDTGYKKRAAIEGASLFSPYMRRLGKFFWKTLLRARFGVKNFWSPFLTLIHDARVLEFLYQRLFPSGHVMSV